MRLGILGGSFDPPHIGHLLAASDAVEALALDRLVFIPNATQPLKVGRTAASPAQRLAMVERLIAGDPRLAADSIEIDRPGLSFSVDTLAAYAARFPDAERFFLVGEDVLASFAQWREPDRVRALARLTVLRRGDGESATGVVPSDAIVLATRRVDVSSTEVRERVRTGLTIHGFVPDAVAAFIEAERLYR